MYFWDIPRRSLCTASTRPLALKHNTQMGQTIGLQKATQVPLSLVAHFKPSYKFFLFTKTALASKCSLSVWPECIIAPFLGESFNPVLEVLFEDFLSIGFSTSIIIHCCNAMVKIFLREFGNQVSITMCCPRANNIALTLPWHTSNFATS